MFYRVKLEYNESIMGSDSNKVFNRDFIIDTIDIENNVIELTLEEFNIMHSTYSLSINDNNYKVKSLTLALDGKDKSFVAIVKNVLDKDDDDYLPF